MKVIGKRISILNKDNLLSIVILPENDKKKLFLMFLWLLAWSVCGIIVLANYFKLTTQDAKLFTIIYLSFWVYFEYKIVRAFIWRRSGKEKLWITDGTVHYQQEISGRGKIKKFDYSLINDFKLIEQKETSFADTINKSFWIKGGERLMFDCQSQVVRFGMQLTDAEAKELIKEINKFIFSK